jgi:hypothetical protein
MKISYSKEERFQQIEDYLKTHEKGTMRQIAKAIKITAGGHLMDLLWQMVDDQRLKADSEEYRPKWIRWTFSLVLHAPLKTAAKTEPKKPAKKTGKKASKNGTVETPQKPDTQAAHWPALQELDALGSAVWESWLEANKLAGV